jgi:hypothetical protein
LSKDSNLAQILVAKEDGIYTCEFWRIFEERPKQGFTPSLGAVLRAGPGRIAAPVDCRLLKLDQARDRATLSAQNNTEASGQMRLKSGVVQLLEHRRHT